MNFQMTNNILNLQDETFLPEINSFFTPILVSFYAQWCSASLALEQKLQDFSQSFIDDIILAKVDIDKNPKITSYYHITQLPTILIFENGEVVLTIAGVQRNKFIEKTITNYLHKS